MASRLMHRRERVIPAQTDHLEDEGGVIGPQNNGPLGSFFKLSFGLFNYNHNAATFNSFYRTIALLHRSSSYQPSWRWEATRGHSLLLIFSWSRTDIAPRIRILFWYRDSLNGRTVSLI